MLGIFNFFNQWWWYRVFSCWKNRRRQLSCWSLLVLSTTVPPHSWTPLTARLTAMTGWPSTVRGWATLHTILPWKWVPRMSSQAGTILSWPWWQIFKNLWLQDTQKNIGKNCLSGFPQSYLAQRSKWLRHSEFCSEFWVFEKNTKILIRNSEHVGLASLLLFKWMETLVKETISAAVWGPVLRLFPSLQDSRIVR